MKIKTDLKAGGMMGNTNIDVKKNSKYKIPKNI